MSSRSLSIVIPLYKQPDLIPDLFGHLIELADEIAALDASILVINDSPDHAPLSAALATWMPRLAAAVPAKLHVNAKNLGFVGSCNFAMAQADAAGADVLLLNSDALLTPGALTEMVAVSRLDPMIAVVSPRSNNATICNSPYPDKYRKLDRNEAYAAHKNIECVLPRFSYIPTAVGFCLLIRHVMLREFGYFDTIYGGGYNEENDLIQRCNARGYRAVLANHAFAFHLGSVSFSVSSVSTESREASNAKILHKRYPHYPRAIERYFSGSDYAAQYSLSGLVPNGGKQRILFDCRNVGPYFNGTFEHARNLIAAFVGAYHEKYEIFIACNHDALVFHGFDKITWLSFCWNNETNMAPFAAVIRCGQPFDHQTLVDIGKLAPVVGYLMLDTIAMDCLHLDAPDLSAVWMDMVDTAAIILYNSGFTAAQFNRRFDIPSEVVQGISLCSTDVSDYVRALPAKNIVKNVGNSLERSAEGPSLPTGSYVLVVGNHFQHKNIHETIEIIRRIGGSTKFVILGVEFEPGHNIVGYASGALGDDFIDELYANAAVVLFPSHYEGFGLPIMHALARQVPVIAREGPLCREIAQSTPYGDNIHLYAFTEDMVNAAISGVSWSDRLSGASARNWGDAAEQVAQSIAAAIERIDYHDLVRRLRRLRKIEHMLRMREDAVSSGILSGTAKLASDPLEGMYPAEVRRRARRQARGLRLAAGSEMRLADLEVRGAEARNMTVLLDGQCDFTTLATACLDLAEAMPMDARLTIAVDTQAVPLEHVGPLLDVARAAMLNAGFYPLGVRRLEARSSITSVRVADWMDAFEFGGESVDFVTKAIKVATMKDGDARAIAKEAERIEEGEITRIGFVRRLLVAPERFALIAVRHVPSMQARVHLIERSNIAEAERHIAWLRDLVLLERRKPGWWGLMPRRWRAQRFERWLQRHGLFDAEAYRARYPDLHGAGIPPLDHYIRHGMAEGRQGT